jgi:hypothetical protein
MRAPVVVAHVPSAIADCADLVIVPTLTRHPLRSGRFPLAISAQSCPRRPNCCPEPRRHCWRRICLLLPILGDAMKRKPLARMKFRLLASRAFPQFGSARPRFRLSDCADLVGL